MKIFVILLLLSIIFAINCRPDETTYSTKYDKINIDSILNNDVILNSYIKCLLDQGICKTKDAKYLKQIIPDAIVTDCSKCNEKQRQGTEKIIHFLIKNKPKEWDMLKKKYDPDGKYVNKYEKQQKI